MKTINRTVVTVSPKQPYIDWANSFDDDGPDMDTSRSISTAYLIPDKYDEFSYEKFIKKSRNRGKDAIDFYFSTSRNGSFK